MSIKEDTNRLLIADCWCSCGIPTPYLMPCAVGTYWSSATRLCTNTGTCTPAPAPDPPTTATTPTTESTSERSGLQSLSKSESVITVRKRSCGKVMFLHLSVSHSINEGVSASVHAGICLPRGVYLPQCMLGYTRCGREQAI